MTEKLNTPILVEGDPNPTTNMGQFLDAFMDDTVTLMDPEKEREYLDRIRSITYLKACCRSDALKFVCWTPSTVTALCSKCKKYVEYNYRFLHYSCY